MSINSEEIYFINLKNIISLKNAQRMKRLSRNGRLTEDTITEILLEQKKPECWNLAIQRNKITKYFPKSYSPQKMEEIIIQLLEDWRRKQRM